MHAASCTQRLNEPNGVAVSSAPSGRLIHLGGPGDNDRKAYTVVLCFAHIWLVT